MCLQNAFPTWRTRGTLVLREIFNSVPMLWDVMLVWVCALCGLCQCVGPLSNWSASSHSAATFSPTGYPACRAKIKTSLSSLFIKNSRLWLLSLLSSLSLPLPLTASSPFLPSLSIGDQREVCFNYWTTFHTGGERQRHTLDTHTRPLSCSQHTCILPFMPVLSSASVCVCLSICLCLIL